MIAPPLASLDLNLLVALDVLLAEQNVTAAAVRLHVSQPAASHALARARQLFGDPLLVRRGNRLVRTPFAELLAEPLRAALHALDGVLAQRLSFDPATDTRTFRVALTDYIGHLYLGPWMSAIAAQAPHIGLDVTLLAQREFGRQLERGELDLVASGLPRVDGVSRELLAREGYAVLVRRGHPLQDELDLDGWCAWPHVVMGLSSPSTPALLDNVLKKYGRTRRVALRVPSFSVGAGVVATTDLVMTLPESLARREAALHGLVMLRPPVPMPTLPLVAAWATRRDHDPALVWLRERLRSVIAAS
jgi:DNA-binding transcriptional LysR family regulator